MPASRRIPSKTFATASARRLQPEAVRATAAGEHQRQARRAIFEIVQRLRIGLRRIGMVDPLHDLPRRGGRRPPIGRDALARG